MYLQDLSWKIHLFVKFGDLSLVGFEILCDKQTNRQTDRHVCSESLTTL